MNVTLTNRGVFAIPFSSTEDKGFAIMLEPSEPTEFNSEAVTVASVGDNPSFTEELTEGLKDLVADLKQLLTFWRAKSDTQSGGDAPVVAVTIENHGPNGLRVLLGSNTNEVTVNPSAIFEATAAGYVEIRELGV